MKFDASSHVVNGGAVFEPWMGNALELVDGSRFEKAGVICVSDVSPEDQAKAIGGHVFSLLF